MPLIRKHKPNIIYVDMDDVGTWTYPFYDLIHPYTADGVTTTNIYGDFPTLRGLLSTGVTFLNGYSSPICSEHRADFMSGLFAHNHGVGRLVNSNFEFNVEPGWNGLPSLPARLVAAGYTAGVCGKWHLAADGDSDWAHIPAQGWSDYRCAFSNLAVEKVPAGGNGSAYNWTVNRNGTISTIQSTFTGLTPDEKTGFFQGDIIFDDAAAFIAGAQEPWCSVIFPCAPFHSPYEYPMPDSKINTAYFQSGPNTGANTQTLWKNLNASLEFLDTRLGELLAGLSQDVRDRTVVIFHSDNGLPQAVMTSLRDDEEPAGPGSAGTTIDDLITNQWLKTDVHEAGIRVPMIISGPIVSGSLANSTTRAIACTQDLTATILDMAGADTSGLDGVSLLGHLGGGAAPRTELVTQTFGITDGRGGDWTTISGTRSDGSNYYDQGYTKIVTDQAPANNGRYKLVRLYTGPLHGDYSEELYKLEDEDGQPVDLWEQNDIIGTAPAGVVSQMQAGLTAALA